MKESIGLKKSVLSLGDWLENQNYKGTDVNVENPPRKISTTLAFSCIGWINLYKKYQDREYLEKAENCLLRILETKNDQNLWLFPFNLSSFILVLIRFLGQKKTP